MVDIDDQGLLYHNRKRLRRRKQKGKLRKQLQSRRQNLTPRQMRAREGGRAGAEKEAGKGGDYEIGVVSRDIGGSLRAGDKQ